MKTTLRLAAVLLAAGAFWGCLEDLTPDTMRIRIGGPAGDTVQLVLSTNFVAGTNPDQAVTEVRLFLSDTVISSLPIDTVVSILPERIFFIQATPRTADSLAVSVRLDADARNLFEDTGLIFANDPWNFVYLFNRNLATSNVEIVL